MSKASSILHNVSTLLYLTVVFMTLNFLVLTSFDQSTVGDSPDRQKRRGEYHFPLLKDIAALPKYLKSMS